MILESNVLRNWTLFRNYTKILLTVDVFTLLNFLKSIELSEMSFGVYQLMKFNCFVFYQYISHSYSYVASSKCYVYNFAV